MNNSQSRRHDSHAGCAGNLYAPAIVEIVFRNRKKVMASLKANITDVIGPIPYRLALAGGWIDQPFVSRLLPSPPGSMVVVGLEPDFRFMERAGIATGTRRAAMQLWPNGLPRGEPKELVKLLYAFENKNQIDPSGSQDMVGLIYPGINRLDYDPSFEQGVFPKHIESCADAEIAGWLERVIHVLPVEPRPYDYSPLGEKNLAPEWIAKLARSGRDCFDAILACDIDRLGASMNLCMACWEVLLPCTVRHSALAVDLLSLLKHYQAHYPGAMYSGCGGGYLFVASTEPVPGAFQVRIRLAE